MKTNNFTELLKKRYSSRNYLKNEISNDNIEKILYDGTLAPSTNNRQPWSFVVVKNIEIKNKISELLKEKGIEQNNESFIKTAKAIYEAPVLLCVFNKETKDESISIIQSIGACIENMLLSATDLGISSLWIRATSCIEKEIEKILEKENEHLMACVTFGYANDTCYEKNRISIKELTKYYE